MRGLAVLLGFAAVLEAAWTPLGPFGGSAAAIAVAPTQPSLIVVATRNGLVYRSTDRGASWTGAEFPQTAVVAIHSLAVSVETPPVFYIGVEATAGGTVLYRSMDLAATWRPLRRLGERAVYSISIWKQNPKVIATGGDDGVYISRDRGESWSRISRLTLEPVTAIALDPRDSDAIFVATPHLPWKSLDGGRLWRSIHNGMIDDSDVFSFEIDSSNPDRVLASACSGLYITNNGGGLWSRVSSIPRSSRLAYTVRQDPFDPQILFVGSSNGFWKSADRGVSWRQISTATVRSIAFDPTDAGALYLASENMGVLASFDHGESIRPINAGFVNRNLLGLSEFAGRFLTTDGTVHSIPVLGNEWTHIAAPNGQSAGNIGGVIEISAGVLVAYAREELFRSMNSGVSWTSLGRIAKGLNLETLRAAGKNLLAGTSQGLYRSEDSGQSWTKAIPDGSAVDQIFAGPYSTNTVIVKSGAGLSKSSDGGFSWSPVAMPVALSDIYQVAVGPDGKLLVGAAQGLFQSNDDGRTWRRAEGQLGRGMVRYVLFHPSRRLAFAVQDRAIYISKDGGLSWSPLDVHGLESVAIRSLAISASAPNRLFALTQGKGIFVSYLSASLEGRPALVEHP